MTKRKHVPNSRADLGPNTTFCTPVSSWRCRCADSPDPMDAQLVKVGATCAWSARCISWRAVSTSVVAASLTSISSRHVAESVAFVTSVSSATCAHRLLSPLLPPPPPWGGWGG